MKAKISDKISYLTDKVSDTIGNACLPVYGVRGYGIGTYTKAGIVPVSKNGEEPILNFAHLLSGSRISKTSASVLVVLSTLGLACESYCLPLDVNTTVYENQDYDEVDWATNQGTHDVFFMLLNDALGRAVSTGPEGSIEMTDEVAEFGLPILEIGGDGYAPDGKFSLIPNVYPAKVDLDGNPIEGEIMISDEFVIFGYKKI